MVDEQIANMIEEALKAAQAYNFAENSVVLLFGSLAEGYGNARSDMDLLIVEPHATAETQFKHVSWNGNRRVEAFFRSEAEIRDLAREIESVSTLDLSAYPDMSEIENLLDLFHRIANSVPVIGDLSEDIRAVLRSAPLTRARINYDRERAQRAVNKCISMSHMGDLESALAYAQRTLEYCVNAYCARADVTYSSGKFIERKLERAGLPGGEIQEIISAIFVAPKQVDEEAIRRIVSIANRYYPISPSESLKICLPQGAHVRSLGSVQMIEMENETFLMPEEFRSAVEDLERGIDLGKIADARRKQFAELYRKGLARVASGFTVMARGTLLDESQAGEQSVIYSCRGIGARRGSSSEIITVHLPFRSLVVGGLELLNAGFLAANAREDVVGAIEVERWSEVEYSYRTLADMAVTIIQAERYGNKIIPSEEFPTHCMSDLIWADIVPILAAIRATSVVNRETALQKFALVQDLFSFVSEDERSELIDSMDTAAGAIRAFHYKLLWGHAALEVDLNLPSEWNSLVSLYQKNGLAVRDGVHRVKESHKRFDWRVDDSLTLPLTRTQSSDRSVREINAPAPPRQALKGW